MDITEEYTGFPSISMTDSTVLKEAAVKFVDAINVNSRYVLASITIIKHGKSGASSAHSVIGMLWVDTETGRYYSERATI